MSRIFTEQLKPNKMKAILKNGLVLWIGVNNIDKTAEKEAIVYNELKGYVQKMKAAGWDVFAGQIDERFKLENQNIIDGFLRDNYKLWWGK